MANKKEIKAAKDTLKYYEREAWMHEISDDFYYSSEQKKIDDANIAYWRNFIKELENDQN